MVKKFTKQQHNNAASNGNRKFRKLPATQPIIAMTRVWAEVTSEAAGLESPEHRQSAAGKAKAAIQESKGMRLGTAVGPVLS